MNSEELMTKLNEVTSLLYDTANSLRGIERQMSIIALTPFHKRVDGGDLGTPLKLERRKRTDEN